MIKSPLKWAGGKSFLLAKIEEDFKKTNCKCFIEAFCGSAVVSLNIKAERVLANDLNQKLINFFLELQQGLTINSSTYSLSETEYYANRTEFNSNVIESKKEAELFYYLNKAGYNGLYRENNLGNFNVPWGKRKSIPDLEDYTEKLNNIQFTCLDYKLIQPPENSCLYLDPPYYYEKEGFTKYIGTGFNLLNHEELINWAVSLNKPFIISNAYSKTIEDIYNSLNLNLEIIEAPRRISCNGQRDNALEIYAKNF